jgi:histidine triad (HIT) family protein
MASIFTKIVLGEIPSYKVAEDDNYLAFLDIFPLKRGHVLVIPKQEVDNLFDLEPTVYQGLWAFAHKVARAIPLAVPCTRVGVAVLGMEVPHAHIHLVPLDTEGDLNFGNPKLRLTPEDFEAIARAIAEHMNP